MTAVKKIEIKKFPGISSRAFEHPTDRAALLSLQKIRGFDIIIRKVVGALGERRMRMMYLGSSVRVGPKQRPELHRMLVEVCDVLDMEEIPELFIHQSPHLNAMTVGVDKPFIVLNSSIIDIMNEEEIRCILGHEAAHAFAGHALYKTVLLSLLRISGMLFPGPLRLLIFPILLGLKEWERKSELTADRGSLLITQNLTTVQSVIIKLAGGSGLKDYNLEEFENQAKEYKEGGSVADNIYKFLNLMWFTHPFPVHRLLEVKSWEAGEDYKNILAGDYPKRVDDEESSSFKDAALKAASAYKEDLSGTADPIADFFKEVAKTGEEVINKIFKDKKAG